MSAQLKTLLETAVTPAMLAYKADRVAELAGYNASNPTALLAGGSPPPDGVGEEYDELVYDIILPAVASAVQLYLQTAVTVVPGQAVVTAGTAVAQTGTTTTPGILLPT
ncbi:MAG: hypothetical protein VW683_01355 [Betaproteobacteria bacterium]|jgi:hypothetical protein